MHILPLAWWLALAVIACQPAAAQSSVRPPVIPAGLDAYRMWDHWPVQRIGARTYMRSTYDRSGGNEHADASHFLFMQPDRNVTLDVIGKGILYFVRTNHWHGSPWHYTVDGNDVVVRETATADPVNAKKQLRNTSFIPAAAFPSPLTYTWSITKGADLMWVPIAFRDSLQLAYTRTHYGTGYYIYTHYANENYLSQPLRSWNSSQTPGQDVLQLLQRAGTDIAPQHIRKKTGRVQLNREKLLLANINAAPSAIRAFKLTLPLADAEALERLRLLVTWDGRSRPSIDAPLSLFFGAGTLHNCEKHEYLVKGFPLNIRYDYAAGKVELACYYPMPFFKSARFEIAGVQPGNAAIDYEIRYEPYRLAPAQSSYFHATYRDFPRPELGHDLTLLDTRGAEDETAWSGNFVGTSFIFSHSGFLGTLEGDPRFFFDDSNTPQAYGTGTEEWGGGGDYWGGENMTLPLAGHPCGVRRKEDARHEKDLLQSAYRFLLADLMPFGHRALIKLEHGGENLSTEHYETVTYWYGLPAPALVKTDELDVGREADEEHHAWHSPQASPVQFITSRYEWGIDSFPRRPWGMDAAKIPGFTPGAEVFPPQQEDGRYTTGSTTFTVKLDPANRGVLLRRTLDYRFPNQRAAVYVSSDTAAGRERWQPAGTWYLAGSNTCMYSGPKGELDERLYNVQTSNRRLRDDEFLLPERLTGGLPAIRIKIQFLPVEQELYPGHPFPEKGAWSELKYAVYSYVMPAVHFPGTKKRGTRTQ